MQLPSFSPASAYFRSRRDTYPWKVAGVFLVAVLFILVRDVNAYWRPVMACEDGGMLFAYYVNQPSPAGIFRFYYGYVSLLPNAIGYVSSLAPPSVAPYVLAWAPLLIVGVGHALLPLRRFRFVVADDHQRIWLSLLVLLFPIGYALMVSNTAYSLWNLLWMTVLLVCAPVGSARSGQVIQFIVLALAICSHPLSIIIVPICLVNLFIWRDPATRRMNLAVLAVALVYQVLGVTHGGDEVAQLWASAWHSLRYLTDVVLAEIVLGYQFRIDLYTANAIWLLHLAGVLVALAVFVLWLWARPVLDRRQQYFILSIGCVVIGITFLSVLGRQMDAHSHMTNWNNRYFYVQQFLILQVIGVLLLNVNKQVQPRRSYQRTVMAAVLALMLVHNVDNYANFRTPLAEGERTAAFMRQLETETQQLAPMESRHFILERPCFNIEVTYTGRV